MTKSHHHYQFLARMKNVVSAEFFTIRSYPNLQSEQPIQQMVNQIPNRKTHLKRIAPNLLQPIYPRLEFP